MEVGSASLGGDPESTRSRPLSRAAQLVASASDISTASSWVAMVLSLPGDDPAAVPSTVPPPVSGVNGPVGPGPW